MGSDNGKRNGKDGGNEPFTQALDVGPLMANPGPDPRSGQTSASRDGSRHYTLVARLSGVGQEATFGAAAAKVCFGIKCRNLRGPPNSNIAAHAIRRGSLYGNAQFSVL